MIEYDLSNKKKEFHLKMILEIMQHIKTFLLNFLEKLFKISELENEYDQHCKQILEHQMSIYSRVITINDLKQFYLAKLQGYLKEELENGLDFKLKMAEPIIGEINQAYAEMRKTTKFLKIIKNVVFLQYK